MSTYTNNDKKRLDAVIEHVNNFLEKGKSKKHSKNILADGINTLTGEHANWQYPNGDKKVISNFATQQNFLKTLVGLSKLTNDTKYHDFATSTTKFFFENFVDTNGLFHWGANRFIDLDTLEVADPGINKKYHALKNHTPFYEFLYEVDKNKTTEFIIQMWKSHIIDWNTFDMKRQVGYDNANGIDITKTFAHQESIVDPTKIVEYNLNGETRRTVDLPVSDSGLSFINFGADLYFAAYFLGKKLENKEAVSWGKFLVNQYEFAKNPDTGLPVYQFSKPERKESCTIEMYNDEKCTDSICGDRAWRQFGEDFGMIAQEANFLDKWKAAAILTATIPMNFVIADEHNDKELAIQSIETILNYLKHSLVFKEGKAYLIPLWNDGRSLADYAFTKGGYFGKQGMILETVAVDERYVYSLTLALQYLKEDSIEYSKVYGYISELYKSLGYGNINEINVNEIKKDNPYMLLALINMYNITKNEDYLNASRKVGDNIIENRFRRGFILKSEKHIYARIADIDTLALITLDACIRGTQELVPLFITETGFVQGEFLKDNGDIVKQYDYNVIYNQTL